MDKVTLENVLNTDIRTWYDIPLLEGIMTNDNIAGRRLLPEEIDRRNRLCVYLDEIQHTNDWVREDIELIRNQHKRVVRLTQIGYGKQVKRGTPFSRRSSETASSLLYRLFGKDNVLYILKACDQALPRIARMWEKTAGLLWAFYDAPLEENDARFPEICDSLDDVTELAPLFTNIGVRKNSSGHSYIEEGTIMMSLWRIRNRVVHKIIGAGDTCIFETMGEHDDYITYTDHYSGRQRKIPILTLADWITPVLESYDHFVRNYNSFIGVIERTLEERKKL